MLDLRWMSPLSIINLKPSWFLPEEKGEVLSYYPPEGETLLIALGEATCKLTPNLFTIFACSL